jgi:hypothetical protein
MEMQQLIATQQELLRYYRNAIKVSQYCSTTIYCNNFAGSISQWKFITLKPQYTTVEYSSQHFYNSNTSMRDSGITATACNVFWLLDFNS